MHLLALALTVLVWAVPETAARADSVAIGASSHVRFATAAEAAAILTKHDALVASMSPFDRSARLQVGRDVPEAEYLAFVAKETRDWTPAERELLRPMLEDFRAKTAKWKMDLPAEVLFLKTTGREEGRAAYCRGAAVVLPQNLLLGEKPEMLRKIVFHELFHVFSSHHPELRRALYAVVGYEVCPELALPPELARRKLTNPDAPRMDSFIRLRVGGEIVAAAPILLGRSDLYDEKTGGAFFQQMDFRFLALAEDPSGAWRVAMKPDGTGARLIAPSEAPDYLDRVGHNTEYVIHPEEILADNFVFLADGAKVPSPEILEKLNAVLAH